MSLAGSISLSQAANYLEQLKKKDSAIRKFILVCEFLGMEYIEN
jgi:hypothetical protein